MKQKRIKYIIVFAIAVLIIASTSNIGFATQEEKLQQDHTSQKLEENLLPIEGTDKVINISELQKNKVIKTGKFKQKEKSIGSFNKDLTEYLKNNKLYDEVGPDKSLSVTCEGEECTYEVIKLGNITTVPQVEQWNYAIEQAYSYIADPTSKTNWNMVTYWKVPSSPLNQTYQLDIYFPSLLGATTILQPVTEWNYPGYGKYWVMTPVFVWNDKNIYTNGSRIKIPVGNWTEGGIMNYGSQHWGVWTADRGKSGTASPAYRSSSIYIYDGESIGFTSIQLEVYKVDYCNQLPGTATFLPAYSDAFKPSWTASQKYTACGLGVDINSPNNVTLKTQYK